MDINVDLLSETLQKTTVSPKGLSFSGKSFKLDTEHDANIVVEKIKNCHELEFLNLEGNTLGVDAAKAIAECLKQHPELRRALWKDMFTGRMKTEIPKALEFLGNGLVEAGARLTELDLSDNAFGPIGVEGLANLLRSSSCYALEELRLNNNGLGITGGKLLATALMDCYNSSKNNGKPLGLKIFIAGRNRLENEGAQALAAFFKIIGTLEEVAMPQNGIYHQGITALSEAFIHNKNLQILNLNDNTIGVQGAKAIAKALPSLQNLKQINFGDCLLKTKGALLLAKALQPGHEHLEELVVGFNEIRTQGGLELVNAVANKNSLKHLNIDGNRFSDDGIKEIKETLKKNGKLNTLRSLEENESEGESEDEDDDLSSENEKSNDGLVKEIEHLGSASLTEEFLKTPNAQNLISLGENREELIIEQATQTPIELDKYISILMKVASLADNAKSEVASYSIKIVEKLYKDLFSWAKENDCISTVNNAILVNSGLIKSEDRKFKPTWNLKGCLFSLKNISTLNFVPESTKDAIKVFMERQVNP